MEDALQASLSQGLLSAYDLRTLRHTSSALRRVAFHHRDLDSWVRESRETVCHILRRISNLLGEVGPALLASQVYNASSSRDAAAISVAIKSADWATCELSATLLQQCKVIRDS